MLDMKLIDHIRNSPLAQDLTERDCGFLEQVMEQRELEAGEYLLREGATDDTLHIVVAGRLAVTRDTTGENITLHVMGPGSLAGEMGFVDGAAHSASIVAQDRSTVLSLKREDFEKLVPEHPNLVYHFMRAIVRLGHATLKRMNIQFVEMSNYITQTHGRY